MPSKKSKAHPKRRESSSPHIQRSPRGINPRCLRKWRLPTLPQRSAVPSAMLSLAAALASLLRCLPPLPAPLLSALSPARRRRAQPTPRMAHTAPHSATPPPMRHTRGGKRRLFLPGQKRYGLSQKRSIGLSFFSSDRRARESNTG